MPLFSKKPKVSLEAYCSEFFDFMILNLVIGGVDVGAGFAETVLKSVADADPSFGRVTLPAFRREINALYTELFGFAFDRVVKKDTLCLKLSSWTKQYFEEKGAVDMWAGAEVYNQTIAKSGHEIAQGKRTRAANTTFLNGLRFETFKKWVEAAEAGYPPFCRMDQELADCMARVANRLGTEVAWNREITLVMLVGTLLQQLGVDELNAEAHFQLRATVFNLYEGARKGISSVSFDVPGA
jgi:hypothetical protein